VVMKWIPITQFCLQITSAYLVSIPLNQQNGILALKFSQKDIVQRNELHFI
jgi:hypothetical protein